MTRLDSALTSARYENSGMKNNVCRNVTKCVSASAKLVLDPAFGVSWTPIPKQLADSLLLLRSTAGPYTLKFIYEKISCPKKSQSESSSMFMKLVSQ